MPLAPATRLGPYEIVAPLGAGGMGEVYRAHDSRLGRDVALKVVTTRETGSPEASARMMREARLAAALNHPNICTLHDAGEDEGRVYLAFELLAGCTLRQRLSTASIGDDELLRWGLELADGLAVAHDAGIVHRDLKPENVFVTERGTVKVLDFGVARRLAPTGDDAAARSTMEATIAGPGGVVGTPAYLAPEQARGLETDARSDVFALGALLYEMATGRRAFEGRTPAEVYDAILNRDPLPLAEAAPGRPADLDPILARALEKDPELRYQGARDLKSDLLRLQRGQTPAARRADAGTTIELRRVLAVLPFENLATDGASDFFAAGITEEIVGQLSRVSELRVLSKHSTAGYRGMPDALARLAVERGVGSVVTGSVRLAAGRVRINVQLADARSGNMLWSEQYDRGLEDVFAVQSDVALQIAGALQARLSPDERSSVERAPTDNVAAYQVYLRAMSLGVTDPEEIASSIELLRMAVHLAPDFATAWSRLSRRLWFRGLNVDLSFMVEGRAALARAIELAPDEGYTHFVRAGYLATEGNMHEARRAHLRGIELDPNNYWSMSDLAYCEGDLGRFDSSLRWALRALPFNTGQANALYHVVLPLLDLEEFDLAQRLLDDALPRFPGESRLQRLRILLDLGRGNRVAAATRLDAMVARFPKDDEVRAFRPLVTALLRRTDLLDQVQDLARRTPESFPSELFTTTFRVLGIRGAKDAGEDDAAAAALAEALAANQARLDRGEDVPGFVCERAMLLALAGDREGTIEWLERAYDAGFRRGWTLDADPTFDDVRDDPRYASLRDSMRADVRRMRERANAGADPFFATGTG